MSDKFTQTQGRVVTTPMKSTDEQVRRALELSCWFHAQYEPRKGRGLDQIRQDAGACMVVVADNPVKLYHESAKTPLFFHPSMAEQRIVRLLRGESDRLLKAADIRQADVVVDATLGLASDALVFAHAVGPNGRVVGIEARAEIVWMLTAAQHYGSSHYEAAASLLKRIDVIHANHTDWLASQATNSADVVYLDPMFRIPEESSASVAPLRVFADSSALAPVAIDEAKRVARRCVVVKERLSSGLFQAHDLIPDYLRRKWAYGVWRRGE